MTQPQSSSIVIFGATGDLTQRKLIPALFNQYCRGQLTQSFRIVGFSIEDYDDDALRERLRQGVESFSAGTYDTVKWQQFAQAVHYVKGDLTDADSLRELDAFLGQQEDGAADRLYYLAISPALYEAAIHNLGQAGMADQSRGKRRVIIEKPYGHDLQSAQALNDIVHAVFDEEQVYRIDHYLGKETAQNILFFRFANMVFESVWDRSHIDNVQITVAEQVDIGHRAGYYDRAGVVRDMFQNHLLQLLTLVTMEPPASFSADELRNEKVKVLRTVRPVEMQDTVRGQYEGYRQAENVQPDSTTPTYAALKLYVDNWRWQDVPFYLRSGKALQAKATEIVVQFKRPPRLMFNMDVRNVCSPNVLSLCIQPDEGMHFRFEAKVPSHPRRTRGVDMEFHYNQAFGDGAIPEAYERLLIDALEGDASLFIRSDEIEAAWQIVDPVINGWEQPDAPPLHTYPRGSWGPAAADNLLARDGFYWLLGCLHE